MPKEALTGAHELQISTVVRIEMFTHAIANASSS